MTPCCQAKHIAKQRWFWLYLCLTIVQGFSIPHAVAIIPLSTPKGLDRETNSRSTMNPPLSASRPLGLWNGLLIVRMCKEQGASIIHQWHHLLILLPCLSVNIQPTASLSSSLRRVCVCVSNKKCTLHTEHNNNWDTFLMKGICSYKINHNNMRFSATLTTHFNVWIHSVNTILHV